jgi:hypothetical protein
MILANEVFAFGPDNGDERIKFFLAVRAVIQMGRNTWETLANIHACNCLFGKALKFLERHTTVAAAFAFITQTVYEFLKAILCHLHPTSLVPT